MIISWPRSYIDVALRSQPKVLAVWRPRKRCPTPRSTAFLIHDPHLDIRSRGQTPTWRCLHILARFENYASRTALGRDFLAAQGGQGGRAIFWAIRRTKWLFVGGG